MIFRPLGKLLSQDNLMKLSLGILIGIFFITLATVSLAPIYPDEIAARIWLSRSVFDFPERINLYPTCVSAFAQDIPITWVLPGFIEWLLHGMVVDLRVLRLEGVAIAITWIALLTLALSPKVWHAQSVSSSNQANTWSPYIFSFGFVIALLSIGVLPVFLVTNRQEQLIISAVILLLYVLTFSENKTSSLSKSVTLVFSFFLLSSIVFYAHPKGLFLGPFLLIIGISVLRHVQSYLLKFLCVGIFIAHIAETYLAWKFSFQCGEAPKLESFLHGFAINPVSILSDPSQFMMQVKSSLSRFSEYPHQIGFKSSTDIFYLPILQHTFANRLINSFIWIDVIVLFIALIAAVPLLYFRKDVFFGKIASFNGALFALIFGLIISSIFNLTKNWYDADYSYVLLIIIGVFFIARNYDTTLPPGLARKVFIYLILISIFSQIVFIGRYLPAYLASYSGPSISLLRYNVHNMHNELTAAANSCNIDPEHSNKLIIDDYTYSYFRKSTHPMAITYIYYMNDPDSARKFISESGSDGIITRCEYLPESLLKVANKSAGNICCISKINIDNLTK